MKRALIFLLAAALWTCSAGAATIATFRTSVGTMEVELFDDSKPITVTNFLTYVQNGKYTNLIVQRWETNFVIQAGGFYVTTNATGGRVIDEVDPYGTITNEAGVGTFHENDYGTIAMARSSETNSAAGQWYFNLTDNPFLDTVKGGYTVFGKVISGTNVLNLFVPPVGTQGIYRVNLGGALATLPVLRATSPTYDDLIYIDISLRRDVGLKIAQGRTGKTITWNSVAKYTNVVEYATALSNWQVLTSVPGSDAPVTVSDSSGDTSRIYRVKLML